VHKDGTKFWYKHGRYHRVDGPAIERARGTKEWFFNGERCSMDDPRLTYMRPAKLKQILTPVASGEL